MKKRIYLVSLFFILSILGGITGALLVLEFRSLGVKELGSLNSKTPELPKLLNSQDAQAEEITLTTYYPSPYGVYDSMVAVRLGVGDTSGPFGSPDGKYDNLDSPPPNQPGNVWIKGNVGIGTTSPRAPLEVNNTLLLTPATNPTAVIRGAMYYDKSDNAVKYHDGTRWQKLVGLPPDYQWITTLGETAFALKDGADATATCNVLLQEGGASVIAEAKYANGKFQVRAQSKTYTPDYPGCDSGWITGTQASCKSLVTGSDDWVTATATAINTGVKSQGSHSKSNIQPSLRCESIGPW